MPHAPLLLAPAFEMSLGKTVAAGASLLQIRYRGLVAVAFPRLAVVAAAAGWGDDCRHRCGDDFDAFRCCCYTGQKVVALTANPDDGNADLPLLPLD